jgi:hypothetical protein
MQLVTLALLERSILMTWKLGIDDYGDMVDSQKSTVHLRYTPV